MIDKSRRFFIFFMLFICLFYAPSLKAETLAGSGSQAPAIKGTTYNFYAGGFHFMTGQLVVDKNDRDYTIQFSGEPHGFLGRLLPWSADMLAQGNMSDRYLIPQKFRNSTSWRGKEKIATLEYDSEGRLISYKRTSKGVTKEREIKKDYRDGPTDVLSGVATVLKTASDLEGTKMARACEKEYPIFDGKRRYDIVLSAPEIVTLKENRYSAFVGEALKCTLTVNEIAGFKKEKSSGWGAVSEGKRDKNETKPMIWLGRIKDSASMQIVRIQMKTDFGTIIAHVAE